MAQSKKLRIAIIGQGRSGRNIHGIYFMSEANDLYEVKYVVERDPERRERAEREYPGCKTFADYTELFGIEDIDAVINVSYSDEHYPITRDLLEHGFNVFVDKPFGRTRLECDTLIRIAKEKGLTVAVFQQSFYADMHKKAYEVIKSGVLGDIKQIEVKYNGFQRRWDWQTVQVCVAGGLYNTGPHPVGIALGLVDFDENAKVVYSKLDRGMTSGDGDDYAKVIMAIPGGPTLDIEVSSMDAFSNFNVKVQGSRGTFISTAAEYKLKYIVDGENEPRPVILESLKDEKGNPIFCGEKLVAHEEEGKYPGSPFVEAVQDIYKDLYAKLTEGREMNVTAEHAARIISVIEEAHAANPLSVVFTKNGRE